RLKFVLDPIYGDHLRGIGHPESPDRVEVVASHLRRLGAIDEALPARDATDEELERVHTAPYLELVKRETAALRGARYLSTGDVVVDERSLAVARRAAGGAIAALEASVKHGEPVFALVRPPGHHAESARGMGFCLFNNVAVAARAYQAQHGGNVLVLDFDYHHGNGTQAVAGDGLSYVSTHAHPAYPGTGVKSYAVDGGAVLNVPLPASGVSTEAFVAIWEWLAREAAQRLRPDAIVVSAGFDYVAGDPVGDLGVEVGAAAALASAIDSVAWEHCGGRVAYVLEGGYDPAALFQSIAAVADSADDHLVAPSGASLASASSHVQETLNQISAIIQGSQPRGAN
ncbi:MAG TPA: histone deacetylase, partial [Candidatus Baltobacteraceae bacterium]|nr:histone deacetylase [Candidatus Baltobacteraceae bacterium]